MKKKKRIGEDVLGLVLHIVGAVFSIPILVLCTVRGAIEYGAAGVLTGLAFSVTMLTLFVLSAIYHGMRISDKNNNFFHVVDYCSIYLLSAGVYTPIALIALMRVEPAVAWTMFGAVWAMAVWGIVMNLIDSKKFVSLSMACYLGLSWCVILCLPRIIPLLHPMGTILMFLGAISYTASALIYSLERDIKHAHPVFHILQLFGSICYGFMILLCVL